jgi:predicted dienelactone hydrolase
MGARPPTTPLDPPHSAFMDAHIPYLAQDAVFTLDQLVALNRSDPNGILTGRLDLQRAGLFGMSMGAVVGGEACRLERRLRAGCCWMP